MLQDEIIGSNDNVIEMGRRALSLRTRAAARLRDLQALRTRQEQLDEAARKATDRHARLWSELQEKASAAIEPETMGLFDVIGRIAARRREKEIDAEISRMQIEVTVAQRRAETRVENAAEGRKELRTMESLQSPAELVQQADELDRAALRITHARALESKSLNLKDPRFESIRRSIQGGVSGGSMAFA